MKAGYYLVILKISKSSPSHKDGFKTDLNDYRPISILLPKYKVFETILHKRSIEY